MGSEDVDSKQFHENVMSLFNSKSIDDRQKSEIFVPKVILEKKQEEGIRVKTVKVGTSVDGQGLIHHYTVCWTEEGERKGRKKKLSSEKKIQEAKKTGKIECDGPCGSYVDMSEVVQFGCDHLICDKCRRFQKSEALYDGSPGCCHPECVQIAMNSGLKLRAGRKLNSASSVSLRSNEGPCEVLHVHVSIVTKYDGSVYRSLQDYEFPTHSRVAELNGVLTRHKDLISTGRAYYSFRKPQCKDDLSALSLIDTNLRFYHLRGYAPLTTGKVYILVLADGVRVI